MSRTHINVLVTTIQGLAAPSTISFPLNTTSTISELRLRLDERLGSIQERCILTTISNKELPTTSSQPISSLLSSDQDDFLSLRLSARLCGGKGGFGSQLRAAGGRMSSKRKNNQADSNGSSRNLDGRRLRTVTEAKALAEYLAIKPEMERKEKEKRRARWEQIVEIAEKREDEIKHGGRARLDGKWMEDREEASKLVRESVQDVMRAGTYTDNVPGTPAGLVVTGQDVIASGDSQQGQASIPEVANINTPIANGPGAEGKGKMKALFGFDEDDEFMSSDSEDESGSATTP